MTTCVALLRGINVGRAKRIAMADLRALFGELGHANARTLINSGHVVFDAARPDTGRLAGDEATTRNRATVLTMQACGSSCYCGAALMRKVLA